MKLLVNRKQKHEEGMNMNTKNDLLPDGGQTPAITKLIENIHSGLDELAKDALVFHTDIYVTKFEEQDLNQAPHVVFVDKVLYNLPELEKKFQNAVGKTIVFEIRVFDSSLMKDAEIEQLSGAAETYNLLKSRAQSATEGAKVSRFYPIGVGFKPDVEKSAPEEQIEKEAVFCHHAIPILDGKLMTIIFKQGGTLKHLGNYKLMVQNDDGIIGTIDPGTPHPN
jgi:hypothetical protein